jgi:hypothetical protein
VCVCVAQVRLYLDRRVEVPYKSNACFGFDATTGWTFFDLTHLHDEFRHAATLLLTLNACLVFEMYMC